MTALDRLRAAIERMDSFAEDVNEPTAPDEATVFLEDGNKMVDLLVMADGNEDPITLGDLRAILDEQPTAPAINPDPYLAMLDRWATAKAEFDKWQSIERDLRAQLFAGAFPSPKEGTNRHTLPDGRTLKGTYTIRREINVAALAACQEALRESGVANVDALVRYKPELAKREWNTLSDDYKLMFSAAIVATPGSPQFEIIPARGAAE